MKHFFRQQNSLRRLTFYFAMVAFVCFWLADITISTRSPGHEFLLLAKGLVTPTIPDTTQWITAVLHTLSFALQGVSIAVVFGFLFATFYHKRSIRLIAALLRSVHEVFWALIFIQLFGLSPLAGVLAIVLPFSGTFGKVFGEQLEEIDPSAKQALQRDKQNSISLFFYTQLPLAFRVMRNYTSYRMECAVRSSVVLGFIGLPTIGFHLETALRTGDYSAASALLYTLIVLVMSLRFWFKATYLWIILPLTFFVSPVTGHWNSANALAFFWDCIPAPLREDWSAEKTGRWVSWLGDQVITGTWNTLVLAQLVLVLTGVFALLSSTLNSSHFVKGTRRFVGDGLLLVIRSLPEYLINFVFLILLGPSMLPAVIAMTLHNGAIVGHLLGKHSDDIPPSLFAGNKVSRFAYYYVPTLFQRFLAYCFYRWEIIIRETAMLGVLGIPTLGFYIDSAFEFLRFDVALILIVVSSVLTLSADAFSRKLRHRFLAS
jgi:phosphonate transport system permease protein